MNTIENIKIRTPQDLAKIIHLKNWKSAKHLCYIESKLLDIYRNKNGRLIVNMPPRHGKSELITKMFPLWWLLNNPSQRIIISTYNSKLSEYFGREILDNFKLIASDFNISLNNSQKSKSEFVTSENGSITAVGVGGTLTGKGADLIIVDDPIKNDKEANSETRRDSIMEWFNATLLTRLEPGGSVILVMTRWHEDDLASRLMRSSDWDKLIFPAIATKEDELNRQIGEPLWPERYSLKDLLEKKKRIGQYWFAGLYQQEPTPSEGGLFKREDIVYFDMDSEIIGDIYFTCDLAVSTSEKADYTVIAIFATDSKNRIMLIDIFRDKLEPTKHKDVIEKLYRKYRPVLIGVESVQYQASLFYQLSDLGLPVVKLIPKKDKFSRALPLSALCENGKLLINRNIEIISDIEKELMNFPNGKHDDIVDALSYAVEMTNKRSYIRPTGIAITPPEKYSLFR